MTISTLHTCGIQLGHRMWIGGCLPFVDPSMAAEWGKENEVCMYLDSRAAEVASGRGAFATGHSGIPFW